MSELDTKTILHHRVKNFVNWIKPDQSNKEHNKSRADKIRELVSKKAEDDGIIIKSTPNAGSFATHTGNRRHYKGNVEVEGQDIDIPFVIDPESVADRDMTKLIDKFKYYAELSYPNTSMELTKSSVKLKFSDKVNYDLVPMFAGDENESQVIIRSTGEEISTSVQKHVRFISSRNKKSKEIEGKVRFHQCIRLVKWWRDIQANSEDSYYLGEDNAPSSFLINLLCAHAYDRLSVEDNYAETLFKWMSFLAHEIDNRNDILFTDYANPSSDSNSIWSVIDPVNEDNNIVSNWKPVRIDELADWFANARDYWSKVIRYDIDNQDTQSLNYLVNIFGTPFKNHCEK